jgi:hypothetical protein
MAKSKFLIKREIQMSKILNLNFGFDLAFEI